MRPLIITEETRQRIAELKNYANKNIYSESDVKAIANGKKDPAGYDEKNCLLIATGYRVVYTLENHPQKNGTVVTIRHISISVNGNNYPNPASVDLILEEFGFIARVEQLNKLHEYKIWIEERAVNIAERVFDGRVKRDL